MSLDTATVKKSLGLEVYSIYSTETLLKAYGNGPRRVREVISGLTEDDLKVKPIPGKWSIAEIVLHLADAEILGACRIRQVYCDHPGPLPFYHEAEWATKLAYQQTDIFSLTDHIELFTLLRKTTYTLFKKFRQTDWEKTGIHPQRGVMTLRGLLELYADHSERHIEQILERRRLLGKPLDIKSVLPVRLY